MKLRLNSRALYYYYSFCIFTLWSFRALFLYFAFIKLVEILIFCEHICAVDIILSQSIGQSVFFNVMCGRCFSNQLCVFRTFLSRRHAMRVVEFTVLRFTWNHDFSFQRNPFLAMQTAVQRKKILWRIYLVIVFDCNNDFLSVRIRRFIRGTIFFCSIVAVILYGCYIIIQDDTNLHRCHRKDFSNDGVQ